MKNFIDKRIQDIKEKSLFRELKQINSSQDREIIVNNKKILNFSSNNYLGLATNKQIIKAIIKATQQWGTGAGASRLISGNLSCYEELENSIAGFKSRQSALVYTTGFTTNIGIISALAKENDAIIIDRLNHASIIDGTKLSKARRFVYKHCDMNSLEKTLKRCEKYNNKFVITDTVFSMDGDVAPLTEIVMLCEKYNASLIVDEAHAFGVFGKSGQGMMNELNLTGKALIDMGTFSKAAAGLGGYVCCDKNLKELLVNTSRSLIYTTGLTPGIICGNIKAIEIIERMDKERKHLKYISGYLRRYLQSHGFNTGNSNTQIIPVIIGGNDETLKIQSKLFDKGFFVPAVRFPTVPKGSAILRISLMSSHSIEDIDNLISELKNL